jgi:hypothetical protein
MCEGHTLTDLEMKTFFEKLYDIQNYGYLKSSNMETCMSLVHPYSKFNYINFSGASILTLGATVVGVLINLI